MYIIRCHNVNKIYDNEVAALVNINLNIEKGEFIFLVGPSGAGKSTLIKLLMGEEFPTEGTVYVDDKNVSELSSREISYLRRRIGVIYQDFKLLPNRTVYENAAFALEVMGASRNRIKSRVPEVLELVGLDSRYSVLPDKLSGGEKQRVSVARAIINNPPLLIADEPTGNLDPENTEHLMQLLGEINQRGTTVLMATHDQNIVDIMQKRVVVVEHGSIVRDEEKGVYSNAT